MNKLNRLPAILMFVLFFSVGPIVGAETVGDLEYSEQVFDFGHVGIEFHLFRHFSLINRSDKTIKITRVRSSCDCSSVAASDSVLRPDDTVLFYLDFSTKDAYGPTTRSFTVNMENGSRDEFKFFYLSDVGQWFNGLKPNPISLFFLPGNKSKTVTIPNRKFDKITLSLVEQGHDYYNVNITKADASRGEELTMEVSPGDDLDQGTYLSSFTLEIKGTGSKKPPFITIPVKIVKY